MKTKLRRQAGFASCREARTIPGLFRKRVAQSPDAIAYREFAKDTQQWRDYTWSDMAKRVARYRSAMARLPFNKGDRLGLLLRNGIDWVAFDIAAMASGFVTVPLYTHDSSPSIASIITHSQCRLILLGNYDRWSSLQTLLEQPSDVSNVWVQAPFSASAIAGASDVSVVELRSALSGAEGCPSDVPCRPEDVATLIYTSGTTGQPKGVMLSHEALLWNAEAVTKFIAPLPRDVFLSLLPLAHAFERTLGYYLPMMSGSTVAYARSVETLRSDFISVRPMLVEHHSFAVGHHLPKVPSLRTCALLARLPLTATPTM